MPQFGLALLVLVGALVVCTGLPVFVVLLVASSLGAVVAITFGDVPPALFGALPSRLVGLLEHDLLQAVPLFVLIGALLDRLPLAELLYRCMCRMRPASPAMPRVAAVGISALLAPMNGSVGASVAMLSRVVAPRLRERGASAGETTALVAVASTLGVLVPPSIVLLLLGDTMMRAHTEALLVTGSSARILNSQDLMHGVLAPAAVVLAAVVGVAVGQARRSAPAPMAAAPVTSREVAIAVLTALTIAGLLGGVALGRFYAVEAAATGGMLLFVGAALAGELSGARLRAALADTLDITGSLFALFVAATTFTLLLRALGTDRWVEDAIRHFPGGPGMVLGVALAVLLLCALVLDAFELIFVVFPILMPPVLARVDDAVWVAVLSMLVLQLSFVLPPIGYAVMMSSARIRPAPTQRQLLRALAPYLGALAAVGLLVVAQPRLVHLLDASGAAAASAPSTDEVDRMLQGGGRPPRDVP
ncbi:MAG: TRAP transporter large permease subunit [Caldimonas sp.]